MPKKKDVHVFIDEADHAAVRAAAAAERRSISSFVRVAILRAADEVNHRERERLAGRHVEGGER